MSVSSSIVVSGDIQYQNICTRGYEEETEETISQKLSNLGVSADKKCLIRFSLRVLNIQNTHCMIKDIWTPEYIAALGETFTTTTELFNSCRGNHPLSPPDFDCLQCNKEYQRYMNNYFEDYGIESGNISNDIQSLHQWHINRWLNCEDGCNPLPPLNNN